MGISEYRWRPLDQSDLLPSQMVPPPRPRVPSDSLLWGVTYWGRVQLIKKTKKSTHYYNNSSFTKITTYMPL